MFKRLIHTLIYFTRCNHQKHTPLFLCVMFHYCLLQAPVVQKVDNAISVQTEHYPMDSAIFSKTTNCTRPMGLCDFVSLWNNLLVLINSKLHWKSCDYLYLQDVTTWSTHTSLSMCDIVPLLFTASSSCSKGG